MCYRLATLLALLAVARTAVAQTQCTSAVSTGLNSSTPVSSTVTGIYNNTCWKFGCTGNTCQFGCLVCQDGSYVGASRICAAWEFA